MTPEEAAKFWHFPESEDPPPGPATDEQINGLQDRYGIKLPESFVTLYQHQNGGGTSKHPDAFWSIRDPQCPVASLEDVAEWTHDDDAKGFWARTFADSSRVIVFFGDGHFYFGLNYDDLSLGEPAVWYITADKAESTGKTFEQWI